MMAMRWRNRRVLVTGGTGFIGSFLVERLLAEGARVRVPVRSTNYRALSRKRANVEWVRGDLRDSEYCSKLVAGVDHVFHLASCRRNVAEHEARCSNVLNANVAMTLALIDALRDEGAVPVTVFSTANVPIDMDVMALARADKVDGYVLGKALSEALWWTAVRQRPFPLLIVRPVGVYGPRDTFTDNGNVIPALMVKARNARGELAVWGSGKQERAFLYVEDVVDALFTLLDAKAAGIQYVTAPESWTVRELAEEIRDLVHPGLRLRFDRTKPEGPGRIIPLPMHPVLRRFPWTPLKEGLRKTYDWWTTAGAAPATRPRKTLARSSRSR
ncbi:MAG: GDP-L-fucose synthase [Candidatus Peregrinibacteria bacterium Gr01-1014_25]|nr:MAG: GDP-L-fucose synthase [Candidatus Peregrinibacteria bacterium Gr01-1014_25]